MSTNPFGTSGDDYLVVVDNSEPALMGNAGNDTLIGGTADDTLNGGTGNDILDGASGSNTYIFNSEGGQDIILSSEIGAYDEILFGPGINPGNLSFSRTGNNLVITITATSDSVTVINQLDTDNPSPIVDRIRFVDDYEPIYLSNYVPINNGQGALLVGTLGRDYLETGSGNDIITGDFYTKDLNTWGSPVYNLPTQFVGGNDTIVSGTGEDYVYGDLSGFYNVPEAASLIGGDDVLKTDGFAVRNVGDFLITSGAATQPITLQSGNDTLTGSTIGGHFYGDYYAQLQNPSNAPQDASQLRGGNDTIVLGDTTGSDYMNNVRGDGYLEVNGGSANATQGNDSVYGSGGIDTVLGDGEFMVTSQSTLTETSGHDVLFGGGGNDYLYGDSSYNSDFTISTFHIQAGNDTIWGGDGDDTLYGDFATYGAFSDGVGNTIQMGNDSLVGGAGNDLIIGEAYSFYVQDDSFLVGGADTITGGIGNDTLLGGKGNDNYLFNLGDGQDIIQEGRSNQYLYSAPGIDWGADTLAFGPNIESTDVSYTAVGTNLVISVNGTSDQVVIENQLNGLNGFQQVEQFTFADGVTMDALAVAQQFNNASPSITGSSGDDYIRASGTYQNVQAGDGNDYIVGNSLGDTLDGGTGNDTIDAGTGHDTLIGGIGNDHFIVNSPGVTVFENVNEGNDTVHLGQNKSDVLFRSQGLDLVASVNNVDFLTIKNQLATDGEKVETFNFADGTTLTAAAIAASLPPITQPEPPGVAINGTSKSETLTGGEGNDTIYGRLGNDVLYGRAGNDRLDAGEGSDFAYGESGNDTLIGYSGNDALYGGDGLDSLDGGSGGDLLFGNDGADTVYGRVGNDALYGGLGDDYLDGGEDNDIVSGEEGNDTLVGYSGIDMLSGGDGNDSLDGGSGIDALTGDGGNDTLYGRTGSDILMGGIGDDYLNGGEDNDSLVGGDGNDHIIGYSGNDTILGGVGNDTLNGESGNDIYVFSKGDGQDTVTDSNGTDRILLDDSIAKSSVALFRTAAGDLQIGYADSPQDLVTINSGSTIERIQLSNGNYLSNADVNQLIQAMAGYANDHSISLTSLSSVEQNASLMAMINGAWHA